MLSGKVTYLGKNFRVYVDSSAQNTILRLMATDGESANFLMDGHFNLKRSTFRTVSMSSSSLKIERLFLKGEVIENGVDISSTEYIKTQGIYELFTKLFAIISFSKDLIVNKPVAVTDVSSFGFLVEETESIDLLEIDTSLYRGSLVQKYGKLIGIEVKSLDGGLEFSAHEDKALMELPRFKRSELLGSDVLKMDSKGKDYIIKLKKQEVYSYIGYQEPVSTKKVELDLGDYSPFYSSIDEVVEAHPHKNFGWIRDLIAQGRYVIVDDSTLESSVAQLQKDYDELGWMSYDTETTGLNFTFKCFEGDGDELVGVILSARPSYSYYFPLRHTKFDNVCNGDVPYFVENYLNPLFKGKKIVLHNNQFDYKVSLSEGIDYNCHYDTMVAMRKTLVPKFNIRYGLKDLTMRFLKRDAPSLDDLTRNGDFNSSGQSFADLPKELVALYGCPDADNTLSLKYAFDEQKILESLNANRSVENDSLFSSIMAYSEFYGMHLQLDALPKLSEDYGKQLEEAVDELKAFVSENCPTVNVDTYKYTSDKVNKEIAYEILGYPIQYDDKTGNPSLGKGAIKFLNSHTKPDGTPMYPFVKLLKRVRDLTKVFTGFLNKTGEYFTKDGFCFSEVDGFKVTGRLSCKKPNYQSFDDLVKHYITPRDGFYLVDMDYNSKENRVIAGMSGEQALIDMFKEPRNDYHRFQAARMNNKLQEQVTSADRQASKGINFGINFGMSDQSLGKHLFGEMSNLNTAKASERRKLFFSFQPNVERWFEGNVQTAIKEGYSETVLGSRRYYNLSTTSKSQVRRYALNHPIQGSAADIYKMGCVDLFNNIRELGLLGKILINGFIHDEMLIEVHNSIHPHVILGLLRKTMMVQLPNWSPLFIGFGVGSSWYDAKKTEWQVGLQEKLENDIDAYDWDGNIDKYYDWSKEKIHLFNAEDNVEMLKQETDFEKVYPVNYSLSMLDYLANEIKRRPEVVNELEFEDNPLTDVKDFYQWYNKAHIYERLTLFEYLYGEEHFKGIRPDWKELYKDLSEIESNITKGDELSEEEVEKEARERELTLLKNTIVDIGYVFDFENRVVYIDYTPESFGVAKKLILANESSVGDFKVIFYSMLHDKFKTSDKGISESLLTPLQQGLNALKFSKGRYRIG